MGRKASLNSFSVLEIGRGLQRGGGRPHLSSSFNYIKNQDLSSVRYTQQVLLLVQQQQYMIAAITRKSDIKTKIKSIKKKKEEKKYSYDI